MSDTHVFCGDCQRMHHTEDARCPRNHPQRVEPPPTDEQIAEMDRIEAAHIAKHEGLRKMKKEEAQRLREAEGEARDPRFDAG